MRSYFKKHTELLVVIGATILSVVAWIIGYQLDITTSYNDAMSHLNVARLVIDNMQPGMSQLGSVWLPMSHIVMLPLIWNDFLWHTGLAGSLISMLAFILSALGIYKILMTIVGSKRGAVIAALAFTLCLNMLYLQSTPLTEPLYIVIFIYTILFLVKYLKYHTSQSLIALGLVGAVGVLTRYDAWFVAVVIGLIIVINELVIQKQKSQAVIGYVVLYSSPIIFAALLWFGWNLLIFGDPLYSFVGPYSARAQQSMIESNSGLITKYNIGMSSWAYLLSVLQNVGWIVSILGTIGWAAYLIFYRQTRFLMRLLIAFAASSTILFNILALVLGFSILNLPELRWNPSGTEAGELFNVRYGILALPLFAIGVGLLVAGIKHWQPLSFCVVVALLLAQCAITYYGGVITVADGTRGSSAFVNQDIAKEIKDRVKPGEIVIMSTSSYNAVAFKSGLPLRSFIHEGVSAKWNGAISEPDKYAKWIVIANGDVGEPVYTSLVKNQQSAFLQKYEKVATGSYANLYKLKTSK